MHSFRNEFFTCLFKIQNVQVIQNDVIKCCKMMSPHSNEPATWRNCVSRRHFFKQWRIYRGRPRDAPTTAQNVLNFMQFLTTLTKSYLGASLGGYGESWVRPWEKQRNHAKISWNPIFDFTFRQNSVTFN